MKSSNILQRISVLRLLFPLMLLTGCGTQQKPQVEYRTISQPKIPLPSDLTTPVDVPQPPASLTFGDSVSLNAELYGALGQCNIDRAAIRRIESSIASQ